MSDVVVEPYVIEVETSAIFILTEIVEQKMKLKEILQKYNVDKAGDIEKLIEKGKIAEHPAYEDYLSALAYETNIKDLKKLLGSKVVEI